MFQKKTALDERLDQLEAGGQVLKLTATPGERLQSDAISDKLFRFMGQPKPFVALVIDLRGVTYACSSGDLTTMVMSMRDDERRQLLPCAVIAEKQTAKHLRSVLKLTQLIELEELAIVESEDLAMSHVYRHLARHTT